MSQSGKMRASEQLNAFTVDLEDWFQGLTSTNPLVEQWETFESRVVPATEKLLGILRDCNVRATFFTLGYVADHHPRLVERIYAAGHEIGVHGYYHRFVYKITPEEFRTELSRSIEAVERITGEVPVGHRAPYFSVNATTPWAFDCMQQVGIQYDSSVFPTRNMLYGYPGAPRFPYRLGTHGFAKHGFAEHGFAEHSLVELPASTIELGGMTLPVAGGFYTRTLPYWCTQWAIKRLNNAGHPAVMYVHPWELDLGQTYNRVTPRERLTHYHGRQGLEHKLRRLLTDFRFDTMATLVESLDEQALWLEGSDSTSNMTPLQGSTA